MFITPPSAKVGDEITIRGIVLQDVREVKFGTATAVPNLNAGDSVRVRVPSGAGNGVSVTTPGGTSPIFNNFTVAVPALAPTITGISPKTGKAGDVLTITGTNLAGATAVTFGTVRAIPTGGTATSLTVALPANAGNRITVTTPGGTSAIFEDFRVQPSDTKPVISSFSPPRAGARETVSIFGRNFQNDGITVSKVAFGQDQLGEILAASYTVVNDTLIRAVVPQYARSGGVIVRTSVGVAQTGSGFEFILSAPTITDFTPKSALPGASITITGTQFATSKANVPKGIIEYSTTSASVTFGGVQARSVSVINDTLLTAVVPPDAISGNVSVIVSGKPTFRAGFTLPAPTISSFAAKSAPVGAVVTINGSNFIRGATRVDFGGVSTATLTVVDNTKIEATVPTGAKSGRVDVITRGGGASASGFVVITQDPPTMTSFQIDSATGRGQYLIQGTKFSNLTQVSFGGVSTGNFTVINATTITATPAPTAKSGEVAVTTIGGTAKLPGFTFVPAPIITGFSPQSATSGSLVTITGENLSGAFRLNFGGARVAPASANANTITGIVPAGANTGRIFVVTPGGTTSTNEFTLIPVSTISRFTPTTATVGATVTITGTNLTAASRVSFGGVAATTYTVDNASKITATVPANAASGSLSVTTTLGTVSREGFTVILAPTFTGFSPASGPAGTSVTITGTNLSTITQVSFWGAVTTATLVNGNITATVPPDARVGNISATTSFGNTQTPAWFMANPTLTSVSPTLVMPGDTITILGSCLGDVKDLTVCGTVTTLLPGSTPSRIRAIVPQNPSNNEVRMSFISGVSTVSIQNLTVIKSISPLTSQKGMKVTISGFNLGNIEVAYQQNFRSSQGATGVEDKMMIITTKDNSTIAEYTIPNDNATLANTDNFTILTTNRSVSKVIPIPPGPKITWAGAERNFPEFTAKPGDTLSIRGTNFLLDGSVPEVRVGNNVLSVITCSNLHISTLLPLNFSSNDLSVRVMVKARNTGIESEKFITLPFSVTDVTPKTDVARGNAYFNFTMTGYSSVKRVQFYFYNSDPASRLLQEIPVNAENYSGERMGASRIRKQKLELVGILKEMYNKANYADRMRLVPDVNTLRARFILSDTKKQATVTITTIDGEQREYTYEYYSDYVDCPHTMTCKTPKAETPTITFAGRTDPTRTHLARPNDEIQIEGTNFLNGPYSEDSNILPPSVIIGGKLAQLQTAENGVLKVVVPIDIFSSTINVKTEVASVTLLDMSTSPQGMIFPTSITSVEPSVVAEGDTITIKGTNFDIIKGVQVSFFKGYDKQDRYFDFAPTSAYGFGTYIDSSRFAAGTNLGQRIIKIVAPKVELSGTLLKHYNQMNDEEKIRFVRNRELIGIKIITSRDRASASYSYGTVAISSTNWYGGTDIEHRPVSYGYDYYKDFIDYRSPLTIVDPPEITDIEGRGTYQDNKEYIDGRVKINGKNFIGNCKVSFGGVEAKNYEYESSTRFYVQVPPEAKSGDVVVTTFPTEGSSGLKDTSKNFTVLNPQQPKLIAIYPHQVNRGERFFILGWHLSYTKSASITLPNGTTRALTIISFKENENLLRERSLNKAGFQWWQSERRDRTDTLEVELPGDIPPGVMPISVVTKGGNSVYHNTNDNTDIRIIDPVTKDIYDKNGKMFFVKGIEIKAPVRATITSVEHGEYQAGSIVTIQGTNFTQRTRVSLNGILSTEATVLSTRAIFVAIPRGIPDKSLTASIAGKSRVLPALQVVLETLGDSVSQTVQAKPAITRFTPPLAVSGSELTIQGVGFKTGSTFEGTVSLGGVAVPDSCILASTSGGIRLRVPQNAQNGDVVVTFPARPGTKDTTFRSAAPGFSVLPPVTITALDPKDGSTVGSKMTVRGTGFVEGMNVSFGGVAATATLNSPENFTVFLPAGTTTGSIELTTPAKTTTATFIFFPSPVITKIPTVAVRPGSQIRIEGKNFGSLTNVMFGVFPGTSYRRFISTTDSILESITVTVSTTPSVTTDYPVIVMTAGGKAELKSLKVDPNAAEGSHLGTGSWVRPGAAGGGGAGIAGGGAAGGSGGSGGGASGGAGGSGGSGGAGAGGESVSTGGGSESGGTDEERYGTYSTQTENTVICAEGGGKAMLFLPDGHRIAFTECPTISAGKTLDMKGTLLFAENACKKDSLQNLTVKVKSDMMMQEITIDKAKFAEAFTTSPLVDLRDEKDSTKKSDFLIKWDSLSIPSVGNLSLTGKVVWNLTGHLGFSLPLVSRFKNAGLSEEGLASPEFTNAIKELFEATEPWADLIVQAAQDDVNQRELEQGKPRTHQLTDTKKYLFDIAEFAGNAINTSYSVDDDNNPTLALNGGELKIDMEGFKEIDFALPKISVREIIAAQDRKAPNGTNPKRLRLEYAEKIKKSIEKGGFKLEFELSGVGVSSMPRPDNWRVDLDAQLQLAFPNFAVQVAPLSFTAARLLKFGVAAEMQAGLVQIGASFSYENKLDKCGNSNPSFSGAALLKVFKSLPPLTKKDKKEIRAGLAESRKKTMDSLKNEQTERQLDLAKREKFIRDREAARTAKEEALEKKAGAMTEEEIAEQRTKRAERKARTDALIAAQKKESQAEGTAMTAKTKEDLKREEDTRSLAFQDEKFKRAEQGKTFAALNGEDEPEEKNDEDLEEETGDAEEDPNEPGDCPKTEEERKQEAEALAKLSQDEREAMLEEEDNSRFEETDLGEASDDNSLDENVRFQLFAKGHYNNEKDWGINVVANFPPVDLTPVVAMTQLSGGLARKADVFQVKLGTYLLLGAPPKPKYEQRKYGVKAQFEAQFNPWNPSERLWFAIDGRLDIREGKDLTKAGTVHLEYDVPRKHFKGNLTFEMERLKLIKEPKGTVDMEVVGSKGTFRLEGKFSGFFDMYQTQVEAEFLILRGFTRQDTITERVLSIAPGILSRAPAGLVARFNQEQDLLDYLNKDKNASNNVGLKLTRVTNGLEILTDNILKPVLKNVKQGTILPNIERDTRTIVTELFDIKNDALKHYSKVSTDISGTTYNFAYYTNTAAVMQRFNYTLSPTSPNVLNIRSGDDAQDYLIRVEAGNDPSQVYVTEGNTGNPFITTVTGGVLGRLKAKYKNMSKDWDDTLYGAEKDPLERFYTVMSNTVYTFSLLGLKPDDIGFTEKKTIRTTKLDTFRLAVSAQMADLQYSQDLGGIGSVESYLNAKGRIELGANGSFNIFRMTAEADIAGGFRGEVVGFELAAHAKLNMAGCAKADLSQGVKLDMNLRARAAVSVEMGFKVDCFFCSDCNISEPTGFTAGFLCAKAKVSTSLAGELDMKYSSITGKGSLKPSILFGVDDGWVQRASGGCK
ncbi:MAG: hypothetical protein EAZ92_14770 [Candidatus Kapaibacterium sp.]|nr:MAG: hypothetical protein EAZ92_14770 [Candidatus Kapabacteria bacterium]